MYNTSMAVIGHAFYHPTDRALLPLFVVAAAAASVISMQVMWIEFLANFQPRRLANNNKWLIQSYLHATAATTMRLHKYVSW